MITTTTTGVAYRDEGAGEPAFLFLPGWCGPRTLFDPLIPRLAARSRILSPDWRGHGDSQPAVGDFGFSELVDDAIAALDDAQVGVFVPVTAAHAGWAAIELRRRLGAERVPGIVLLDWMVLGAPPPFREALTAMMDPSITREVVDQIATMWVAGLDIPDLKRYVKSMASMPDSMWGRAAREIAHAFDIHGSPLHALSSFDPPPPTLHLYAQPPDPSYLEAQLDFATSHPWFRPIRLDAASHFPAFEVPDAMAGFLEAFVSGLTQSTADL
ncbi:MAG: alpha/beta fold hydrolase [Acidimicrobiia bacterium]